MTNSHHSAGAPIAPVPPLWLYRVLEQDDDGDPLQHGVLRAASLEDARPLLHADLRAIGLTGDLTVRCYPLTDRLDAGVLASDDFHDLRIALPDEEDDDEA